MPTVMLDKSCHQSCWISHTISHAVYVIPSVMLDKSCQQTYAVYVKAAVLSHVCYVNLAMLYMSFYQVYAIYIMPTELCCKRHTNGVMHCMPCQQGHAAYPWWMTNTELLVVTRLSWENTHGR